MEDTTWNFRFVNFLTILRLFTFPVPRLKTAKGVAIMCVTCFHSYQAHSPRLVC